MTDTTVAALTADDLVEVRKKAEAGSRHYARGFRESGHLLMHPDTVLYLLDALDESRDGYRIALEAYGTVCDALDAAQRRVGALEEIVEIATEVDRHFTETGKPILRMKDYAILWRLRDILGVQHGILKEE